MVAHVKRLDGRIDKIRCAGATAHLDNAKRITELEEMFNRIANLIEGVRSAGPVAPKPGNGPWIDHRDPRLLHLERREQAYRSVLIRLVSHYQGGDDARPESEYPQDLDWIPPLVKRASQLLGPMAFCGKCSKPLREGVVTTISAGGKREHVTGSPDCAR
jgi:hypothetical protein